MRNCHHILLLCLILSVLQACNNIEDIGIVNEYGLPIMPISNISENYMCSFVNSIPLLDGRDDELFWRDIQWSSTFYSDVNGKEPYSEIDTKFKMAYNKDTIYFLIKSLEPHIWATSGIDDSPYFDDEFLKVFVDCNLNEYDYVCFQVNALGDLFGELYDRESLLPKQRFDLKRGIGAKCNVYIQGTLNNPYDTDEYWQAEIAIPFNKMVEGIPLFSQNEYWKLNVQRFRWQTVIVSGLYKKMLGSDEGRKYEGESWSWSALYDHPISEIEFWGNCIFDFSLLNKRSKYFVEIQKIKWELRNVYYAQLLHYEKHGRYAHKIAGLKDVGLDLSALKFKPNINARKNSFDVSIKQSNSKNSWNLNSKGEISFMSSE